MPVAKQACILGLLVCVTIICNHLSQVQVAATDLKKGYKQLNLFLREYESGLSAKDYLNIVRLELKRQNRKPIERVLMLNADFRAALKELCELEEIVFSEPRCNLQEYYVFKKIESSVGNAHRYFNEYEVSKMKPLLFIVHQAAKKRAIMCREEWQDKFNETYGVFNSTAAKLAEFKRPALNEVRKRVKNDEKYVEYILSYQLEDDAEAVEQAYAHLILHSAKHSESETFGGQKCAFHGIIDKYLREPCYQYERKLGFPILFQARYDHRVFSRYSSDVDTSSYMIPFYEAMLSDVACKHVLDYRSNFRARIYEHWFEIQRKEDSECYKQLSRETRGNLVWQRRAKSSETTTAQSTPASASTSALSAGSNHADESSKGSTASTSELLQ